MKDWQELFASDIFKGKFTSEVLYTIASCSWKLYEDLDDEYIDSLKDFNVYTWSRSYNLRVKIFGRTWHPSYINYLLPSEIRIITSPGLFSKKQFHICNTISYEHINGGIYITCDECSCDDDIIYEFIDKLKINKNIEFENHILGKLTKGPHLKNCPIYISNHYI